MPFEFVDEKQLLKAPTSGKFKMTGERVPGFLESLVRAPLAGTTESLVKLGGLVVPGDAYEESKQVIADIRGLRKKPEGFTETLKAGVLGLAEEAPLYIGAGEITAPLKAIKGIGVIAPKILHGIATLGLAGGVGGLGTEEGVAKSLAKGAAMGVPFGLASIPASRLLRTIATAGVGGVSSMIEGAKPEEVAAQSFLFGMMGAISPSAREKVIKKVVENPEASLHEVFGVPETATAQELFTAVEMKGKAPTEKDWKKIYKESEKIGIKKYSEAEQPFFDFVGMKVGEKVEPVEAATITPTEAITPTELPPYRPSAIEGQPVDISKPAGRFEVVSEALPINEEQPSLFQKEPAIRELSQERLLPEAELVRRKRATRKVKQPEVGITPTGELTTSIPSPVEGQPVEVTPTPTLTSKVEKEALLPIPATRKGIEAIISKMSDEMEKVPEDSFVSPEKITDPILKSKVEYFHSLHDKLDEIKVTRKPKVVKEKPEAIKEKPLAEEFGSVVLSKEDIDSLKGLFSAEEKPKKKRLLKVEEVKVTPKEKIAEYNAKIKEFRAKYPELPKDYTPSIDELNTMEKAKAKVKSPSMYEHSKGKESATLYSGMPVPEFRKFINKLFTFAKEETGEVVKKEPSKEVKEVTGVVDKFIKDDVHTLTKEAKEGVKTSYKEVIETLKPYSTTISAKRTAAIMSEGLSRIARSQDIAAERLKEDRVNFSKQTREENFKVVDYIQTGKGEVPKQFESTAATFKAISDDRMNKLKSMGKGKDIEWQEKYFPQLYKNPEVVNQFLADFKKKTLTGGKGFLKEKLFPTFKDALEWEGAGGVKLEPLYNNPVDIFLHRVHDMDRFIFGHETMTKLKSEGIARFVRLGEEKESSAEFQKIVSGKWSKIDDSIASVTYTNKQGQLVLAGHYYAPESAARVINNYLSASLRSKAAFRFYLSIANSLNQSQLGLSAFHFGFTSLEAMQSKVALALYQASKGDVLKSASTFARAPFAPIENILAGDKLYKEGIRPGSQGAEAAVMVETVMKAGGRIKQDSFYRTKFGERVQELYRQGNYIGAALRSPFAAMEYSSVPIMEYLVPRQKLGVFADIAAYEMKRLEGQRPEVVQEALVKAWQSVDNRMGQIVYDNLYWNNTFKDLAMASVRSLGWNLGTIREVGGGLVDIGRFGKAILNKQTPEVTHRMSYVVTLPITVGAIGGMIHYLYNGEGPKELVDYFFPKTGRKDDKGRDERFSLPSYVKDIVHIIHDPVATGVGKLNPAITSTVEMLNNKDFYGAQIRNGDDSLVKQAIQSATYGVSLFKPLGFRAGRAEAFIGLTPAPAFVVNTKAENVMSNLLGARIPQGAITPEHEAKLKVRNEIIGKIKRGEDIPDELADQFNLFTLREKENAIKTGTHTYLQNGFSRLTLEESLKVWKAATPEEKQELTEAFGTKIVNAMNNDQIDESLKKRLLSVLEEK